MHAKQTKKKRKKDTNKFQKLLPVFLAEKQLQERRTREVKKRGEERKVINLSKGEKPLWEEGVKCKDVRRLYDGEQNTAAKSGSLVFFVLGWLV